MKRLFASGKKIKRLLMVGKALTLGRQQPAVRRLSYAHLPYGGLTSSKPSKDGLLVLGG